MVACSDEYRIIHCTSLDLFPPCCITNDCAVAKWHEVLSDLIPSLTVCMYTTALPNDSDFESLEKELPAV